jgi:guanidinoacetate N-methyltransferase
MKRETELVQVSVEPRHDGFASAPTDYQRDWLLRRALLEFSDDLHHLHGLAGAMVPGEERPSIDDAWKDSEAAYDDQNLIIQGQQVMQAWERPLMRRLAELAGETHGDVLEIGFGMGISAGLLQDVGVRSHTIVEANEEVAERFAEWKKGYPGRDIRLVQGMWQDVSDQLDLYDGILFDTYPLSQQEYVEQEVEGTAYSHAAPFFPLASERLRPGGVFTYFTCEIDTLSRSHQRLLLEHFDSFSVGVVRGLEPPVGCQYWWNDSMVAVAAKKGG